MSVQDTQSPVHVEKPSAFGSGNTIGAVSDGVAQTSVGHAGEWFSEILGERDPELPMPILMSDALISNHVTDKDFVMALCNSHGRRGFAELAH